MADVTRRDVLKVATTVIGGALISNQVNAAENTELKSDTPKLIREELKPKPLSFDPKKLNGISEKLITSHWENNYVGAIKTLNAVNKKLELALAEKDFPAYAYNGLKREHLMRSGSVVFHDLYFENLGNKGKLAGSLESAIKKSFTDVNTWETEFRRIAQGLGGGSGWVVLGFNYHLNRLENYWAQDHLHGAAGVAPIMVMDMYEHAYQMDYGAAAAKYIDAFFLNINWEVCEKRLETTKRWQLA